MNPPEHDRSPSKPRLAWIVPGPVLPFWYAGLAWSWWRVFRLELPAAPSAVTSWLPAVLMVVGKSAAFATETAAYALLWRSRGRELPFWRLFAVIVTASTADLFAHALGAGRPAGAPLWLAAIAGLHLAAGTPFHEVPAVRAAFGSIGLLTAARLGMTASAQARALGLRVAMPLLWTVGVWLASRLVILWTVDLLKGVSPILGG
jgi:hypothetical protein